MVASIINRGDPGDTTEDLRERLSGRIAAMARTQTLLTRGAGVGVELEGMVRDELLAHTADRSRVSVEGLPVTLAPKAAEVLTLASHELPTTVAKFGAIRAPAGKLSLLLPR